MSRPNRGKGGTRATIFDFRIGTKSNNTCRWSHIENLYKKTTLVRDLLRNICTKLEVNRYSGYWEEVENVSSYQRPLSETRAAVLDFGSARKTTTLGRDLIRNICTKLEVNRYSSTWEEVENVSANQRAGCYPGGHLGFSDRHEK